MPEISGDELKRLHDLAECGYRARSALGVYDLEAENKRLRAALWELNAMVAGECPSLLDEDSGGNGVLGVEIDDLLSKPD